MKLLLYLLKNINLLNIALAGLITAGVFYIFAPTPAINLKVTTSVPDKPLPETKEALPQAQNIPPSDYTIIAEQNLFHPDRKIPAEKKAEAPKTQPEFVLYGTLLAGDISLAYIEDMKSPQSTPGRGKRQTTLKKGDTLSGFTLKEIEKDKIVMVRGEDSIVVHLTGSSKSKTRAGTSAQPAQPQPVPVAAQPKAEGQKTVAPAPQPSALQPQAEKKAFASEKEKTATESARKTLLDFFKQPPAR